MYKLIEVIIDVIRKNMSIIILKKKFDITPKSRMSLPRDIMIIDIKNITKLHIQKKRKKVHKYNYSKTFNVALISDPHIGYDVKL